MALRISFHQRCYGKRLEKDNAEEGLTTSPKIVHDVRDSEQEEGDHDDEEQTGEPIF